MISFVYKFSPRIKIVKLGKITAQDIIKAIIEIEY
jgi:hypothetical protein